MRIACDIFITQTTTDVYGPRIVIINVILVAGRTVTTRRRTLVFERSPSFLLLIGFSFVLNSDSFRCSRARFITTIRKICPITLRVPAGGFVITTITTITMSLGRGV